MSESMVERVARTIEPAAWGLLDFWGGNRAKLDAYRIAELDLSIPKARAAVAAMRYEDGTDEHLAILVGGMSLGVDAVGAIEVHEAWIDAALSEQP